MGELVEVANALVSPIEKLLEGMQKAFGRVYEPRHLRKMADAKAYEIKKLGETIRENSDIPIEYNCDGVLLSSKDYDEFVKRTQGRLAFQELRKQENIESVAGKALTLLDGKPEVEGSPLDIDWIVRFFNAVESVGNEELQNIWARILAGEIQKTGSFSLRTLDTLRNISQKEAGVFQRTLSHALNTDNLSIVIDDKDICDKVPYGDIMVLGECGLVNATPTLSINLTIPFAFNSPILWSDNNVITVKAKSTNGKFHLSIYPLTNVGREIAQVLGFSMSKEEMQITLFNLQKKMKDFEFALYNITSHNGTSFTYDDASFLDRFANP